MAWPDSRALEDQSGNSVQLGLQSVLDIEGSTEQSCIPIVQTNLDLGHDKQHINLNCNEAIEVVKLH